MREALVPEGEARSARKPRDTVDVPLVLVIDDAATVRYMVRGALERAGYRVQEAANGEEGIAQLQCATPNLVITDIFMPVRDGIETIKEIRSRYPGILILAISGAGTRLNLNMLKIASRLGAHATLKKPFSSEALLAQVKAVLGSEARPT